MGSNYKKNKNKNSNNKKNKQSKIIYVLDDRNPLLKRLIDQGTNFRKTKFNELPIEKQIEIKERNFNRKWNRPRKSYDYDAYKKQREKINDIRSRFGSNKDDKDYDPVIEFSISLDNMDTGEPVTRCPLTGRLIKSNISSDYFDDWNYNDRDIESFSDMITERLNELNMSIYEFDDDDDIVMSEENGFFDINEEFIMSADDIQKELEEEGLIVPSDYSRNDLYMPNNNGYDPCNYNPEWDMVSNNYTEYNTEGEDSCTVLNPQDDIEEDE